MASHRDTVVVAGGAGYIGRSLMEVLWKAGFAPICLDNYSSSRPYADPRFPAHKIDLVDAPLVESLWKTLPPVKGVFHFAAHALVGESQQQPAQYFHNNLLSTVTLADIASQRNIPLVHSSSCAVYGIPDKLPIVETLPFRPISPYGQTKCLAEQILEARSRSNGLRVLNLRYFNPGGAVEGASHGENHSPETHLIPNVVRAATTGEPLSVFGDDYPTPDGSCIRDFIHIQDLVEGHLEAFRLLQSQSGGFTDAINLGSGKGTSVFEVIAATETVVGRKITIKKQPRRAGDPPALVAGIDKARKYLKFAPKRGLTEILKSHLNTIT